VTSNQLSALGALLVLGGVLAGQVSAGTACASAQSISSEGGLLQGNSDEGGPGQGMLGDGGACPNTTVCEPGVTEQCGNCGTATCDPCGQWGECTDQGICKPGDEGPDGCYEGQDARCNASCEWVCP
jgi:hypothetical protein